MDRKDFLTAIGIGAASVAVFSCAGGSKSSDASVSGVSGPVNIDFTLDLSLSAYAALLTNSGFLASNGVIVARTTAGAYIAVQQSCTHEKYPLVFQGTSKRFYYNNHGSYFNEADAVQVSPANSSLTTYTTALTGSSLRVHS